jgi:hypothetical protein
VAEVLLVEGIIIWHIAGACCAAYVVMHLLLLCQHTLMCVCGSSTSGRLILDMKHHCHGYI